MGVLHHIIETFLRKLLDSNMRSIGKWLDPEVNEVGQQVGPLCMFVVNESRPDYYVQYIPPSLNKTLHYSGKSRFMEQAKLYLPTGTEMTSMDGHEQADV